MGEGSSHVSARIAELEPPGAHEIEGRPGHDAKLTTVCNRVGQIPS
jgi:hypothetical protein